MNNTEPDSDTLNTYESEGHWYALDGTPVYEVQRSDGLGTRPTTVRDAAKLSLVPSVTTIMSVLYKPGLAAWINQQYVLAALTLPRHSQESLDDFAKRVVTDSRASARSAAEAGTRIHKIIEWWLGLEKGEFNPPVDEMTISERHVLRTFDDWQKQAKLEVDAIEHAFTHFANDELGYGGRLDCLGSVVIGDQRVRCVIDWKTQETRPKQPINIYPEWGVQSAGYSHGIREPDLPGLSVVFSRNEPGRMQTYLWTEAWRWPAFEALKYLYHTPLGAGSRLKRDY